MKNPYQPIEAVIEEIFPETSTIKTFVLKVAEPFEFRAGQFVELTVPGVGEAPFTPSSSPYLKESLEVTIMNAGRVTASLHNLSKGDKVGIRGPYGHEYPLAEFKDKEVLIVGGGVGLAPLRALFLTLVHTLQDYKKIVFCYGAKTSADIVYKNAILADWQKLDEKISFRISVDVGDESWQGRVGLVTTTLDELDVDINNSVSVVCGPPIMMKFTTFKLLDLGYSPDAIYLSMEKNMSCGIGKCGHCRLGKYYVCKDGPIFTYEKIQAIEEVWD
jgi:sulfite reductase subunit B